MKILSMAKRQYKPRQERPFPHRRAAENTLWELLWDVEEPESCLDALPVRLAEGVVRAAQRRPDVSNTWDLVDLAVAEMEAQDRAVSLILVLDRQQGGQAIPQPVWKPQPRLGWRAAPDLRKHLERYPVLTEKASQPYGVDAILSWAGLSPQEADIVMLRAAGLTVEAIATMLRIRPARVQNLDDAAQSQIHLKLAKYLRLVESEAV